MQRVIEITGKLELFLILRIFVALITCLRAYELNTILVSYHWLYIIITKINQLIDYV